MNSKTFLLRQFVTLSRQELVSRPSPLRLLRLKRCPQYLRQQRRYASNPADDPNFTSFIDQPAQLVRSGRQHKPLGLIILALIPITAFGLGTWQVQRLSWKTDLLGKLEDRIIRDPLPLPPIIDPNALPQFDYRRIVATGKFDHSKEMLIGPRLHDGDDGYLVITPLLRPADNPDPKYTILVNRGWISRKMADQRKRRELGGQRALPDGEIQVEGLLRMPWKRNMFSPVNKPEEGKWYFPDVGEMAEAVGSQKVWVEETMEMNLMEAYEREPKGVPIGRPAEVNIRNNHLQYIVTWYALCAATSVMMWMVVRKPPSDIARRVRQSKEW